MSHATFYAGGTAILKEDGTVFPMSERPVVRWREKVSFEIRLQNNASFPAGYYRYAFDFDCDFLHTAPCNAGECTLSEGKLTFDVIFNSLRQAEATNGRRKPIPFYFQISTLEDDFSEYILDDVIWLGGCVWDGRGAPAEPATDYYTKEELDRLIDGKLDVPSVPGETGYVLGIAEDGSIAWVPQTGGHGDVAWEDITDKPDFASVATSGDYDDLQNKPTMPVKATNSEIDSKTATTPTIVPANLSYAVRSVLPNVTTIPASNTAYTLYDASSTINNHSWTYEHAPTSAPTYTLPAVTDVTVSHEIILDVDFTTVQTFEFQDSDGNTLTPQRTIAVYAGDRYRFICVYRYGMWLIYPLLMQATTITPTTPVSVSGDTSTAISVQLSATAGNNGTLTYTATGLPTGVTCSSSGLISGTPTTAGSYTATVTVSNPYARPATIVVNFTIAQGSSVPQSLTVSGTGASSNSLDGTYALTNDTVNSRPVWYNSTRDKYIWAIENGMDAGWFAWVVGAGPTNQVCAGDTMMFYNYCTYDVQGLSNLSDSPDQSTKPWYSYGTEVSSSEFSVSA